MNGDTEAGDAYFSDMIDDLIPAYEAQGYQVESSDGTLPASVLSFTCKLLSLASDGHIVGEAYAWVPLASNGAGTYYVFVEVYDGYDDGGGNARDISLNRSDLLSYLDAVAPSKLMP